MRLVAALLFMGLVFAGCTGETDELVDTDGDGIPDTPKSQVPKTPPPQPPALELSFRAAVDLGTRAYPAAFGTSCQDSLDDGDCGLGEPSVEVDSAGTIYVTGVCCIGSAPPVLVSRDGGATFQDLAGDEVRELFGIEADLAIDALGRLYVADIEFAGTFQVTVWEADGSYVRHMKWPAPPLVDRDWIRAEGDGILYYVYNTGTNTNVYKSTDGGMTWSPTWIHQTGFGLGNAAIWPGHELCIVGGGGGIQMQCSRDGGTSFDSVSHQMPTGGGFPVPVFDEAGNLYVATGGGMAIHVAHRPVGNQTWQPAVQVSPPGQHHMPWIAGGRNGSAAVAWYGTLDENVTASTEWFLFVGASLDATAADPTWTWAIADPEPILTGSFGRQLLDFLQVDMGPDGAIHVAYSRADGSGPDGNEERLVYVRTEPTLLAMQDFWLGP